MRAHAGRLRVGWDHNRGIGFWKGKVFAATWDGRLVAIDAQTGKEVWQVMTVDPAQPLYITGAQKIFKGKVLIGNGGTENGPSRGYVTAYDAETGKCTHHSPVHVLAAMRIASRGSHGRVVQSRHADHSRQPGLPRARGRHLRAYAADTGKELWQHHLGLGISAPPITYAVGGKQYVAILVGFGGGMAGLGGPLSAAHGWAYGRQRRAWWPSHSMALRACRCSRRPPPQLR